MTQIEVIAIGDEVLSGFTPNTNAAFISHILFDRGYRIARHTALPDEEDPLLEGLRGALKAQDVVICTGGLGPTVDDVTRGILAKLTDSTLELHEEVKKRLQLRLGLHFPLLDEQSTSPSKATPLHNPMGTAPGLFFQLGKKLLFVLPGVPREMEAIFPEVLRILEAQFPPPPQERGAVLHFFQIAEIDLDTALRAFPKTKVGLYPHLGFVTVRLLGEQVEQARQELSHAFGSRLFASPSGSLEEAVHLACINNKLTLAAAESCTGGGVSERLIRFPGASEFFKGSIVAYSNEIKEKLLAVNPSTLLKYGAVSEETVVEMVRGLLPLMEVDVGVAISGIAGPTGGTLEKPVGTVCFAAMRRGKEPVFSTLRFAGSRAAVIERSINHALAELLKIIILEK
ncbi:MAG: nicotinamide-nucleotide amidohydrolase family protein [Verrucomicrobia bacterium]|nr:nicotinamide-nucleotide amidohydrolase family protein [Verrucomicrobiota bacterium]